MSQGTVLGLWSIHSLPGTSQAIAGAGHLGATHPFHLTQPLPPLPLKWPLCSTPRRPQMVIPDTHKKMN